MIASAAGSLGWAMVSFGTILLALLLWDWFRNGPL